MAAQIKQLRKDLAHEREITTILKKTIKRVGRLMKAAGIQGRHNQRKKPLVTDSRHGHRISKNKLKETPFPTGLRQVIVTDTTYVWTDQGWHYLATVMDLFSREIIGWAFSANNDRHLVCQALWNASSELTGDEKIIHHSDRGSTYCSDKYRNLMESFFGSLKCECAILGKSMSPAKVKLALFDYIEGFYNTHRIHTALKGESPREFARKALAIAAGGFISDEF